MKLFDYIYVPNISLKFCSILLGSPHGIVVNVLGYDIVVNEFKLQSCYHVHFRSNTLGKGMNSNSGLNSSTTTFGIK